jgi:hypothetical protein
MNQPRDVARDMGASPRSWRTRIEPDQVDLPCRPGARRLSGLRREEVAWLAGVSTDYVKRLEQGRAHPSTTVGRLGRVCHPCPAEYRAALVADLQDVASRYPADRDLAAMITELRTTSPEFAHLWDRVSVAHHGNERKTIDHPDLGALELDCDVLTIHGADLCIVVFTVPPGSEAAEKLRLLTAFGTVDTVLIPAHPPVYSGTGEPR